MAQVIIFGLSDSSSLAHVYLKHDSKHDVIAFTVSKEYMPDNKLFEGCPVVPFEDIESVYSPQSLLYKMFVPLFYSDMNKFRERIYNEVKSKGYSFISYISSKATVCPETEIGENCFILENNTIQPFVSIGNNCVLWSGNHIGHHGKIKDHNYFTSHVVMSGRCVIESYCFLGVNSAIRDGVTIAEGCLVAMGASVTKNTKPWGTYMGTPAKRMSEIHKSKTI